MKKLTKLFVLLVMIFSSHLVLSACGDKDIIVSGKPGYPPVSWGQNGELTGLGYTVVKGLITHKAVVKTRVLPWKRVLVMAEQGMIDVVVGIRETPERSKHLAFIHTPLIEVSQNVFHLKGTVINSKLDLKTKKGGFISGTVFNAEFAKYAKNNLTLSSVDTLEQNLKKLEYGRIQYFISPLLPTIHYINKNHMDIDIAFMAEPLFTTIEKIAISKASSCVTLLDGMDKALQAMHQQDFIYQQFDLLTVKWDVLKYLN